MTKLKIGDNVVMNDRYYDKHQGEVFTIKAGPEMIGREECFWLDGYDGAYCADGLDLYKPQTNEEWFCQLTTEEKAKWMAKHMSFCEVCEIQTCRGDGCQRFDRGSMTETDAFREWLKEKKE